MFQMFYKIRQCFFILALSLCFISGCSQVSAKAKPRVAQLNQGWTEQEVEFYNHASEGTNLAPLDFVLNLRDPENPDAKFIDNLSSEYGFIPSEKSDLNPYGLPVGFAIDKRPVKFGDRSYLGVTCAACHTRQLTYHEADGSKWILPVHGGPGLIDFPRFQKDLFNSFLALLDDDALMNKFATDLLQKTPEQNDLNSLRQEISEFIAPVLTTRALIEKMQVASADFGPGNLNALTKGYYNNVGLVGWMVQQGLIESSGNTPLRVEFEGSVNYPPMWFASHDDWAQWFAEIHHPGSRNWTQAVSTSPVRPPKMIKTLKQLALLQSINFDNIEQIQESLERLQTPQWPEYALGQLDSELIAQGKVIFQDKCAQCHTESYEKPNLLGIKFNKRLAFDVGTDPTAYEKFGENGTKRAEGLLQLSSNILQLRKAQLTKQFGEEVAANYIKYDSKGRPNKFALAQDYYGNPAEENWEKTGAVYWSPPMAGIFASAPYFHNGSVPTLWDVLSPPEERPTSFHTGSNEFDSEHVGLKNEGSFIYNTEDPGKGNGGHLFGTKLPPSQKLALIEYLKSI